MSRTGKPTPHTALLVYLTRAIDKEQFGAMKSSVKSKECGGFLGGELEKMDNVQKLLERMEHKGVFKVTTQPNKVVDYTRLKGVIEECQNFDALTEIADTERKLEREGYYVVREDHSDAGCSSLAVMETNPPLNVNNSRSDKSDAIPSGLISVADSTDSIPSDEFCYAKKGRGYLLFINIFENSGEPRRKGSEKDKDSIEALFEDELKFKCVFDKDLTKPQLLKLLQKTKDKLVKGNFSSFFLIIGSHGEQFVLKDNGKEATVEGIVTIDKKYVTEEELTKPFLGDELIELRDKPKVFIIQACRAPRSDRSDDMETSSMEEDPADPTPASIRKPINADMLISYATTKGTKAWRNDDGSWYISELCKAIKKDSKKKHLLDILVRVNLAIAKKESTEECAKQMPCQISTLTKDFWL